MKILERMYPFILCTYLGIGVTDRAVSARGIGTHTARNRLRPRSIRYTADRVYIIPVYAYNMQRGNNNTIISRIYRAARSHTHT